VYSFGVLVYEVFSGGQFPFGHLADEGLIKLLTDAQASMSGALFVSPVARITGTMCGRIFV
jgi:hypothetical protein